MYDIETIFQPKNIDEAIAYLHEHENSMIICGGSDVLVQNRDGKHTGIPYVSIRDLPEIQGIKELDNGDIIIGAASTFSDLEYSEIIQKHFPFLSFAGGSAGGPQLRNIGTIGGNLCNGVTSAETPTSILCLNGLIHLHGPKGKRVVPATEFNVSAGKTVRERDEILTHIEIKNADYDGYNGRYYKYAMRNAMDIATLSCCVLTKISKDKGIIEDVRIAYGVAAPTPKRAYTLEGLLKGSALNKDKLIQIISDNYKQDVNPRDSFRASKVFRLHIIRELTIRCLFETIKKGGVDLV